jgi:RNA polymerase sigma factor (sigma-70 family)
MAANRQMSDQEVLGLLQNSRTTTEGITYLYQTQAEPLSWFITQNGGAAEDAQDIFQEVVISFVHLVQQGKFRGESSIKTFLFSINRNLWFNEVKRRGRAGDREKKYELTREERDEPAGRVLETREASLQLMRMLDDLGDTCKKILVLYYYEGRSMKEILQTLSYENEQVVRNKKHKCLKKLEEMIQGRQGLGQQLKHLFHG